jgi:hypothetical protein
MGFDPMTIAVFLPSASSAFTKSGSPTPEVVFSIGWKSAAPVSSRSFGQRCRNSRTALLLLTFVFSPMSRGQGARILQPLISFAEAS